MKNLQKKKKIKISNNQLNALTILGWPIRHDVSYMGKKVQAKRKNGTFFKYYLEIILFNLYYLFRSNYFH